MQPISYAHDRNLHSQAGAARGISFLLDVASIKSVLDVGAGTGTWMRAALDAGVALVEGVDGIAVDDSQLRVDPSLIRVADLRLPLKLDRRYDAVLCFEVAEHLPAESAETLVRSLCNGSDLIFFSAAAPGQFGDHHINCQWPAYWQELFNRQGFECEDAIRRQIWDIEEIEPWYRQNIFVARRSETKAGSEQRIAAVVHPAMLPHMALPGSYPARKLQTFESGIHHPWTYLRLFGASCLIRVRRLQRRLTEVSIVAGR